MYKKNKLVLRDRAKELGTSEQLSTLKIILPPQLQMTGAKKKTSLQRLEVEHRKKKA